MWLVVVREMDLEILESGLVVSEDGEAVGMPKRLNDAKRRNLYELTKHKRI